MIQKVFVLAKASRLFCHPKKCFLMILLFALLVFSFFIWNWHHEERVPHFLDDLSSHSKHRNYSFKQKMEFPVFLIEPKMDVCRSSVWNDDDELGSRERFESLLNTIPDWEEPASVRKTLSSAVILVPSHTSESKKRNLIRRTWGSGAWMATSRARVVFVCQTSKTSDRDEHLVKEAKIFGDILHLIVDEHSQHIFSAALGWMYSTCSRAHHLPDLIIKCTSDTFINVDNLLAYSELLTNGFYGEPMQGLFSGGNELKYLDGSFFLLKGSSSIKIFFEHFSVTDIFSIEEVSITGIVADAAPIPRFRFPDIVDHLGDDPSLCWINQRIVFTHLKDSQIIHLWHAISDRKKLLCRSGKGCCEDSLLDNVSVIFLAFIGILLSFSVVHTYIWSSTALFCTDLCNAVDSGAEDSDLDTPNNTPPRYDSDSDMRQVMNEFGRPYDALPNYRF